MGVSLSTECIEFPCVTAYLPTGETTHCTRPLLKSRLYSLSTTDPKYIYISIYLSNVPIHIYDIMTTTTTKMTDITEFIQTVSKQLNYKTPYISTSDFDLYESMSALDVMDPKMDGCEVPLSHYIPSLCTIRNQEKDTEDASHSKTVTVPFVPPRPLPKSLHDDTSPLIWDDLNLSSTKLILMEMLIRLESFLQGNSVAETIYTCLYVHEDILQDMFHQLEEEEQQQHSLSNTEITMTTTAQQCVFFASILLIQLTDDIIQIVQKADIYEEEDFTMNRYQFRFASDVISLDDENDGPMTSMEQLKHWYHTCFQSLQVYESDIHVRDIEHILQYLFQFYMACRDLSTLNKDNVSSVSKEWYHSITNSSYLQDILENLEKGSFPDDTMTTTTNTTVTTDIGSCFDTYANRHRLGNTPIRKVVFQPYKEALQSLDRIYKEFATSVCHLLMQGNNTLKRSQCILAKLSKSSSLNITSRSLMVMNLFFDDLYLGQYNLAVIIIEDMKRFGIPSQVMETRYGMQFVQQLCKPTYDALKLLMLNRSRQRIFMDALIFKEWSALQSDATIVDATFQQEYELGSNAEPFVMKYMVAKMAGFMEHYLSLGMELNLFPSHHSMMTVYWYLDFLQSTEVSMTTSMKKQYEERKRMELRILQEEADAVTTTTASGGKKGNKKKGKKNKTSTKLPSSSLPCLTKTPEDLEDDFHLEYLNIKHMMYRGIFRVSIRVNDF